MRKHMISLFLLSAALVACGGHNPTDEEPTPTPPAPTFPVGTPTGEAARATVGPEGGTVSSADGKLSLRIPAGALATFTEITVQPITSTVPNAVGGAYRLGPEGVTFKQPVGLTFKYDEAQESTASVLAVTTQDGQGAWQAHLDTAQDREANTLTVQTNHFSDWSWAEAYKLDPGQATVLLGKSVKFTLMRCVMDEAGADGDDLIAPLAKACSPQTLTPFTRNWAVNGTAGGSAAVGTVRKNEGDTSTGTYQAPAARPSVNPVAVSVDLVRNEAGKNILRMIAYIKIIDGLGPCEEVFETYYKCTYPLRKFNGQNLPYDLPKNDPTNSAVDRLTGGYLQLTGYEDDLLLGIGSYEVRYEFDHQASGTDHKTHRTLNDVGNFTSMGGHNVRFKSISKVEYTGNIEPDNASVDNFPMGTPTFSGNVKLEFAP
ncbi:hypothetical protein [Deinococcus humi]|uniref:ZU5 domain-containing protein n=1 Tax=Deinococcus humi TaxID=662880 RepID=A0A7W8NEC0_9DEIO|nr:hypothetical protein [Deinococcus humi]MBB5364154.1 hypothetical protein [Deinococcus humi]GGO38721.1 hypothetical protein GCM10008949_45750 [Deinococcus humi]